MRTVWKYPIKNVERQTLFVPCEHGFLHAGIQDGVLCLWALVNPQDEKREVTIEFVGTGWDIPMVGRRHISTIQDGIYVWHIFERL